MNEKFERIDLDDYIQTGEGGTAITYSHKDGMTLAKLFMSTIAADNAAREFRINQVVYESGLPTPKPIRLITDGTRFGTEYELVNNKRSFTRIISQEPDQLVPLSVRFAMLAKQIHQTPADTTRLPDMRDLVATWIDRLVNFPDGLKARFHRFLDGVPSTPTCLHGDLHICNIITDGQRDLWIDVGDFAYGTPEWDLGLMYYTSNFLSAARADNLFHLDCETLGGQHHDRAVVPQPKTEKLYVEEFETERELKACIEDYISQYNTVRPHMALGYETPAVVFAASFSASA